MTLKTEVPLLTVAAVVLAASLVARPALAGGPPDPPTAEQRRLVRLIEDPDRKAEIARALDAARLAPGRPVDVEQYRLDIRVVPATTRVEGAVTIRARSLMDGLSTLEVDLYDQMGVSAIASGGSPASFTRGGNVLDIALDKAYDTGDLLEVVVEYGGTPPPVGYGAFTFRTHSGQPIISSLSEPTFAPAWWPCIDHPDDKALVEMNLNVPGALTAVSNGLLTGTTDEPDGTRTWRWASTYPISTYLVSVAISNYSTWTDWYQPVTGGPAMPVQHWVYPEHLAAARQDLSVTVPQITFFSSLFGEYPFVGEKYGHAIFPFGGGMEHQTVTSYGAVLIRGDNAYDWIVAHELAHQWWGDSVTLASWDEIWLNEGFATYSEALWWEDRYGSAALRSYMSSLDSRPFCGTLHAPGCDPFGHTVYDKGAWVLHMLRGVLGDAAFFQGLREYAATFSLGNATTPDFRAVMEAASGRDLAAFFTRWVYEEGEPSYRWGWTAAWTTSGWVTHLRIEQIQPPPLFEMPIRVRVTTAAGPFETTVDNAAIAQDVALPPLADPPLSVELDPDGWILKTTSLMALADADADGVPDTADNCAALVNPGQDDLDGDRTGDACDADIDGDARENALDCAPADPGVQDPPQEATRLDLTGGALAMLSWDADPLQGTSLTFEVLRGDASALIADGGVTAAACFASSLALPQWDDPQAPAAGAAMYYLVRKRNVCGAGTLGAASSGLPRQSAACP